MPTSPPSVVGKGRKKVISRRIESGSVEPFPADRYLAGTEHCKFGIPEKTVAMSITP